MGIADCHSGSERVPSSFGGCSTAVACAFLFDCSILGPCAESGDKKQRQRTIRSGVTDTGLARDSVGSPLNAMASSLCLGSVEPRAKRQRDDGTWMRHVQQAPIGDRLVPEAS